MKVCVLFFGPALLTVAVREEAREKEDMVEATEQSWSSSSTSPSRRITDANDTALPWRMVVARRVCRAFSVEVNVG